MRSLTPQQENVALARHLFEEFQEHGMDGVFALLHADVEAHPSVDGAPVLKGREAVAEWWRHFTSLDGELEARPLDYEVCGDCVIVRGYLRQRAGRSLSETQIFWLYEIRDGLVVRMESLPTRNAALARTG